MSAVPVSSSEENRNRAPLIVGPLPENNAIAEQAVPPPASVPTRLSAWHTPSTVAAQLASQFDGELDGWIRVNLHPEDLGPLMIRVSRNGDSLSATIGAADSQTLGWLEQNRTALLDSLRSEGLPLDSLELGNHTAGDRPGQHPAHENLLPGERGLAGRHWAGRKTPAGLTQGTGRTLTPGDSVSLNYVA